MKIPQSLLHSLNLRKELYDINKNAIELVNDLIQDDIIPIYNNYNLSIHENNIW